jgi:hypothetical protein
MVLNHLLIWMSSRGKGSWPQFRSAVEEYHVEIEETGDDGENAHDTTASDLPVYQAVRLGLQRLAHVEFFSSTAEADWRVVPPALSITAENDRCVGVMCGARFPNLDIKLGRLNASMSWDSREIEGMPDRIRLVASDLDALLGAAKELGMAAQVQAPASLLAAIPPVDDPRSRFLADPPDGPGWAVERFITSDLRWTTRHLKKERDLESRDVNEWQTGLFRFRMKYQRFHFLRWRGTTYRVDQVQVGKYAILRSRRVRRLLQYDRKEAVFSVPVSCRPPLLIERALVLCTGLPPDLDKSSGRLEYSGVPQEVARLAAGVLRQEIQIL